MSCYTWKLNIASALFHFPVQTTKLEFTQDHPFPHMGDILSYLNTGLYSLTSKEEGIGMQYQNEVEIIRKNEISLHVTEANW